MSTNEKEPGVSFDTAADAAKAFVLDEVWPGRAHYLAGPLLLLHDGGCWNPLAFDTSQLSGPLEQQKDLLMKRFKRVVADRRPAYAGLVTVGRLPGAERPTVVMLSVESPDQSRGYLYRFGADEILSPCPGTEGGGSLAGSRFVGLFDAGDVPATKRFYVYIQGKRGPEPMSIYEVDAGSTLAPDEVKREVADAMIRRLNLRVKRRDVAAVLRIRSAPIPGTEKAFDGW